MKLLVVGSGTMGRWFATAVADIVESVAFADHDVSVARSAANSMGDHATVVANPNDLDENSFTIVCIAVPMPVVTETVRTYAPAAESAILDVTGVMGPAIDAMKTYSTNTERASLHPLFAPANEPGTVAVVPDEPGPVIEQLLAAIESRGNDLFETTSKEHDTAMESVQARAHAAVLSYAIATEDVPEAFHTPVSRRLAAAVADVTGDNSRVYGDIQEVFDGAEDVADAAQRLADADRSEFEQLYAEASARKTEEPEDE